MFATTRWIAVGLLIVAFVSASVSAASLPDPRSYLVSDLYSSTSRQFIGSFSFMPNMENRDLVTVRVEKPFNFIKKYVNVFGGIRLFDRVIQECQTIGMGEQVKNIKGEEMAIAVDRPQELADNRTFKFEMLTNSTRGSENTILDHVVVLFAVNPGQRSYSPIGCGRIRYADSTDDFLEELYTKEGWPPVSPLTKLKAVVNSTDIEVNWASVTTDGESRCALSSVAVSDLYSAADQKFVGSFSYVRKLGNRDVVTIEVETPFNLTSKYFDVYGAIYPFETVKPECATDGKPMDDINGAGIFVECGDSQILASKQTFRSIQLANLVRGDEHTILDHVLVMFAMTDTYPDRHIPIACGRIRGRYVESTDNFIEELNRKSPLSSESTNIETSAVSTDAK